MHDLSESGVLGIQVSGADRTGWLRTHTSGPELISGGPFGVEASLVVVLIGLALAIPILVMAVRRGRIIPPPWRAR